MKAETAT